MDKRFIVIVIDGFGIGAMKDAITTRPGDEVSNTLKSIINDYPELKLPNLEKLGLMNAAGFESKNISFSPQAIYGKSELLHFGADTFMGHQEIMGALPQKPKTMPFQMVVDRVKQHLIDNNHKVEIKETNNLRYLLVDDYCTVADNIDADLGMAYNCTAPLDYLSFEKLVEIAKLVREKSYVNRIIPFGGTGNTIKDILKAEEVKGSEYIGIHAVNSKSYVSGYKCLHLGYGVDNSIQAPTILTNNSIDVSLFGKVADVVINNEGKSISCVNTTEVLDLTIQEIKELKNGFICTNIQETDLAGHSQDSKWYKELLEITDKKIGDILKIITSNDILLIMADHGNDPNIGHNRHTRECVPILVHYGNKQNINIGTRKTLSDVGATVCDFFNVNKPQNGISFLSKLR